MKRITRGCLTAAMVCLLSGGPARAQQPNSLTLEAAIDLGLQNNASLHGSLMRVEAADARLSEVNASRLPSVKVGASYTRLSDVPPSLLQIPKDFFGPNFPPQAISSTLSPVVLDNYNVRFTVQQPLFTGFRLQSSANAADYASQAASEDYARDKSGLIVQVTNAYWNLYKAGEFKKVVDENVEQMKAHLKDVQNFLAQGVVTKNEVLKVEVQLSNVQLIQIDAANNVRLASINLSNLIGLPLGTEIAIASQPVPWTGGPGSTDSLVRVALENRHELRSLDLRVKAGESAVTAARAGWFPQIFLSGNYYYSRPNQRFFPTQDEFKDTWDVSLTASLDLWNWGATLDQTHQAQAQLQETKDALSQVRDAVALEVTQSSLALEQARERIDVSEAGIGQAEENLRITNEKFKSGLALNSDVLDAEAALLQAKWNHIQSVADQEVARAHLRSAVGER